MEDVAERLNQRLVRTLERQGLVTDARVAAAFRATRRHHFLPAVALEDVYDDAVIVTRRDALGVPTSSSSQPAIMAIMLEQLDVLSGHRVLEIGAGSGYNAALLAYLAGPDGRVVSVDIDPEVAMWAQAALDSAGAPVEVVVADGALSRPEGAPYDRIIVTAGASDLAEAWLDELSEGGVLVVPLHLAGPAQLSAAFVRRGRALFGRSLAPCGFMPMRGKLALYGHAELDARVVAPGRGTGLKVPVADLRNGFETWLGLAEPGYLRVRVRPEDPPSVGLSAPGGLALLEGTGSKLELVVHGAAGDAARRLAAAHARWSATHPGVADFAVDAYPRGSAPPAEPGTTLIERPRFTFRVRER
ncbi:MAG: methyltransferase domain-containing protein [Candidatus Dormibacteraeota bacterium]|nr:methyltransferase domain-containing protein [Candidatus Dormibacteraeota bacterium]